MIKGIFSPNDLVSAAWVHMRPRRGFAIAGILIVVLGFVALWVMFFGPGASAPELSWARWGLVGSYVYLFAWLAIGIPYKSRRSYKQRKDLQRECTFAATDAGLSSSNQNAQGVKPWEDYLKWKEGKLVFLVYLSDNMFQIIPKRFFDSAEEINAFRQIVRARVPRQEV